ncbi:putative transposase [Candidatus Scalindua japonica]|uniref:putative transposase n=1 Tax=Candidatus Scalindua japonica TaxID=1284222 RepID=UPI003B96904B
MDDQQGQSFFVISTPFTTRLVDILRSEIVPRLLKDVRQQHTEEEMVSGKPGRKLRQCFILGIRFTSF